MLDIIKGLIDLTMILVNGFYAIPLEISEGNTILFGNLVIGFLFIIGSIYLLLKILGVNKE